RAPVLGDGRLQFRYSLSSAGDQEAADDLGDGHRLGHDRGRYVARAIPDYRSVALAQVSAVRLGNLPPHLGRDNVDRRDVRGDGAVLSPVCQVRADYFDLGAESRHARGTSSPECVARARSIFAHDRGPMTADAGLGATND